MIAVGLGILSFAGCLIIPPEAVHDAAPNSAGTPSPTASPVHAGASVRRVAPPPQMVQAANPNTPVQFIAIPADQLVYDATGRPMAKADAIPPGYTPVVLPPGTNLPNNTALTAAPAPTTTPILTSSGYSATSPPNSPNMAANREPVEIVTISHTAEPPLAPADLAKNNPGAPKLLPETVSKTQAVPDSANKSEPLPLIVNNRPKAMTAMTPPVRVAQEQPPLGGQLIVFPQPSGYNPVVASPRTGDGPSNMLIPPVAPEELRLVSTAKTPSCNDPLTAALKAFEERRPEDADRQLAQIEPASRELLRKMLPVAARLGDSPNPTADPAEIAELVDQLQVMVGTLRAKAALRIEKLSYCRTPAKPVRMGGYQPLADDHAFHAGETIELYMELRNFSCEAKDREYLTHLTTAIEIRDERNDVVARFDFERDRPDVIQAPRQDYFHICRFPVQGLLAGQYTLCAIVTDVPTGKSATKTLPLRVESAHRVAR
jgi:hypothetical protein